MKYFLKIEGNLLYK